MREIAEYLRSLGWSVDGDGTLFTHPAGEFWVQLSTSYWCFGYGADSMVMGDDLDDLKASLAAIE